MKYNFIEIIEEYLKQFPEEIDRQKKLINYINKYNEIEIIDWNNFDGHIVASAFIYAKKEKKFLMLYHKDLKMFLYPGGHIDTIDKTPLNAVKREIKEETGLIDIKILSIFNNELIPIDIDTHIIEYNERLDLPEHYHFDFRYMFTIDEIIRINIESEEVSEYRWISLEELKENLNYGQIIEKIVLLLN